MLGYPGSGKTTTATTLRNLTGAVHLWADKIRNERYPHPTHSHAENLDLYNHLNQLTAELLATGQSVIFDTGFNFYKDRQYLREIATEHHAKVILVWVQTEKELAKSRATHDGHAVRNTYPLPMSKQRFERIADDFEPPHPNERYIALDGTKITEDYLEQKMRDYL